MPVVSKRPLIFLAPPAEEDSRIDIGFNNPQLFNDFGQFEKVQPLGRVLLDVCYGTSIKCHEDPQDGDVPILRMNNLVDGIICYDDLVYASRSDVSSLILDDLDVLINRTNGSKKLVGKCALYRKHLEHSFASYLIGIRANNEEVLPEFIVLYLQSAMGRNEIDRRSFGAPQCNLSSTHIKSIPIPIIPTKRQEIILSRYKQIDAIWRHLRSLVSSLKESLFIKNNIETDKLFANEIGITGFYKPNRQKVFFKKPLKVERLDVPANHPDYTCLIDQIKDTPLAGTLADLVDVSKFRFNPDDHNEEEINYLAIGDIDGISGNIISPQLMLANELPSRARRLLKEGDILVGIAGASTGTENMVVFTVSSEQEGWVASTGFIVLRPKEGVNRHYVAILLKAPFVLRQIRSLLTSPAMPTISESDLLGISVPFTSGEGREKTLIAIKSMLSKESSMANRLEAISEEIDHIIAQARSNIFDLLDDVKFFEMSKKSKEIESAMDCIEGDRQ